MAKMSRLIQCRPHILRFQDGSYRLRLYNPTELQLLTHLDWKWEAIPHGVDGFLVAFPTVEELHKLIDIDFHLKSHGATISVSEWEQVDDPKPPFQLDNVWLHVAGVPLALCHYLGI